MHIRPPNGARMVRYRVGQSGRQGRSRCQAVACSGRLATHVVWAMCGQWRALAKRCANG
ncbi:UNVERIFIED_CONTAM: hypothetical protein Sradi_0749200 [Sesamum radiatum]|uniref:Uncharacterized protein n=1 Tax=Sesamum radiatum TaxID=300843 RepID=A0AAW2VP07_SESRA